MKLAFFSPKILLALGPTLAWGQASPLAPPHALKADLPKPTPFTVQGQLNRPLTGMAYLFHKDPSGQPDSARLSNGRFTLRGTAPAGTQAALIIIAPGQLPTFKDQRTPYQLYFYLEPGTIQVTSPDSLPHATALGTPLNDDNARLTATLKPVEEELYQLLKGYQAASPEQRQDKAFREAEVKQYEEIEVARKVALASFIKAMPQSMVSLTALSRYTGPTIDPVTAEPLFRSLASAVRHSAPGQEFAAKLASAKRTAIGAMAPNFTQHDVTGKPVKLSDFRGKYVLVDFWASWCGPCRQENPNVVAAYNQYKSRNFTVLGVSLDRAAGREAWLKAIATDHLSWTQVSDLRFWQNEAAQRYGIQSIPQNVLVGPDGRIIAKNVRGATLGKTLAAKLPLVAP